MEKMASVLDAWTGNGDALGGKATLKWPGEIDPDGHGRTSPFRELLAAMA